MLETKQYKDNDDPLFLTMDDENFMMPIGCFRTHLFIIRMVELVQFLSPFYWVIYA